MKKKFVVYLVTNIVNGKYYVGWCSTSIEARMKSHITDARNELKTRTIFHRAIMKYGIDKFLKEVLGFVESAEEAKFLERLWILFLKSYDHRVGYNMTYGGDGGDTSLDPDAKRRMSPLGRKHTEETKRKIGLIHKGKSSSLKGKKSARVDFHHTEETKQRLSFSHIGNVPGNKDKPSWNRGLTSENKGKKNAQIFGEEKAKEISEKISLMLKGKESKLRGIKRPFSEEHKKNILDAQKRRREREQSSVGSCTSLSNNNSTSQIEISD